MRAVRLPAGDAARTVTPAPRSAATRLRPGPSRPTAQTSVQRTPSRASQRAVVAAEPPWWSRTTPGTSVPCSQRTRRGEDHVEGQVPEDDGPATGPRSRLACAVGATASGRGYAGTSPPGGAAPGASRARSEPRPQPSRSPRAAAPAAEAGADAWNRDIAGPFNTERPISPGPSASRRDGRARGLRRRSAPADQGPPSEPRVGRGRRAAAAGSLRPRGVHSHCDSASSVLSCRGRSRPGPTAPRPTQRRGDRRALPTAGACAGTTAGCAPNLRPHPAPPRRDSRRRPTPRLQWLHSTTARNGSPR